MITEQAGGACTTGTQRMMDIEPLSLHQRVPLIFGSKTEVEEVERIITAILTPTVTILLSFRSAVSSAQW